MQHITNFPLDAVHLYRQPQNPAVTLPQLKIIAFLDPYMKFFADLKYQSIQPQLHQLLF